ncbi:MAG: bifunctional UDP-N-acetylglucosamine diphosphorylase/glucosamine-1-phosphate N-acetyltransferase GlmU [SAR86 cluster bacterium]|uniref:Bifunctional protein GlmU n=1 Tax=SAR86 cluster bacterium TaxID=2030880 RepID=A0A937I6T4_9GAMM|nr:bifunctional UDP-N-acetylglucosamine diphosphorylase/glucosamine-1-phosphate N-acetyltransferase GlmU [SAR86 cluster bacterium]
MKIDAIILAAGKGKRMQSALPKVLQQVAGKALLQHVLDTSLELKSCQPHIVLGDQATLVKASVSAPKNSTWSKQVKQLGTGHAVKQALKGLRAGSIALILYGDVPLVKSSTMNNLVRAAGKSSLALLSFEQQTPKGYGRIIRSSQGKVLGIVEEKDATQEQKKITEVNSGIMAIASNKLEELLKGLKNKNAAKEYYLTDTVGLANENKIPVKAVKLDSKEEVLGANNLEELNQLERNYQLLTAKEFVKKGVIISDPNRVDFRGEVKIQKGSSIDINCVFEGKVEIGKNVIIGPGAIIKNTKIGDGSKIEPYTFIENAILEKNVTAGPYAHIGPDAHLEENSEVGNFVEVKRSKIGKGTKAKHLAYIGDGQVAEKVNVGAGTIFVNYDGKNKNKTKVDKGAFIGSNSSLIAPIKIGQNSMIGAGSVVTSDVPAERLALGRSRQRNIKKK